MDIRSIEVQELKLVSNNSYNFRHHQEPIIVGMAMLTPSARLGPRLCYKVMYSDGFIDYVAKRSVDRGDWSIEPLEHTRKETISE